MANEPTAQSTDGCPHCGKPVELTGWNLLPSLDRTRVFTCAACGGKFDLTNACKMSSMFGGMFGMAVAVFLPFGWIVKAGHGSRLFLIAAVGVVALGFGVGSIGLARMSFGLERKS
jgi:hypothetical protein